MEQYVSKNEVRHTLQDVDGVLSKQAHNTDALMYSTFTPLILDVYDSTRHMSGQLFALYYNYSKIS